MSSTIKPAAAQHETRRRVMAIVAGSSGNLVEWYDFYVYSFCALYFAPAFFPKGDTTTQLLSAAGVFAAGFLMRPIGGWFFGRFADRQGRRAAMVLSVLMMCGGSLLIAVLPTYETIGAAAAVLLVIARLLQGLSVGGEYGTSATYMSEVALAKHRGFFSSFQYVTLIGGQLMAVLVLVIMQQILSHEELMAWGWRVPFFLGAILAIVALFLRRTLPETLSAKDRQNKEAGTILGLRKHYKAFLQVLGLTAGGSLAFYTYTTYMQKYLVNTAGMDAKTASLVMTGVLFVYMLLQPLFGALADRIGRKPALLCFTILTALTTVPLLRAIGQVTDPWIAFALILAALVIVSFYTSISGLVKAELFPTEVRAIGVGLSYAIGNALFGGTAEYVALWFKQAGSEQLFYYYVCGMAVLALLAVLWMPDSRDQNHLGHGDHPVE
ncbi:MAG: MFS family transporter [Ferrovibrio sp.]|uniref:MFS family transporter n=1 Tax=Ferrovibrio sp. TaxID=1917215 RepID=UPI002616F8ED|nr:MFS family transporter [Ferrovibrio sp.]MCW0235089.1 MFS family transporter [Ferrovibrio sp.]